MFNVQNYKDKISLLEENIKTLKEKLEVAERSYIQRDREATFLAEKISEIEKENNKLKNIEYELNNKFTVDNENLLMNLKNSIEREDTLMFKNHELRENIKNLEVKIEALEHANNYILNQKVDMRQLLISDPNYWKEVYENGLVSVEEYSKKCEQLSKLYDQFYDLDRDYNALKRKYDDLKDK